MSRPRFRRYFATLVGAALISTLSCGNFNGLVPVGTGTLRVLITDGPFPFECVTEATVTITRIDVRIAHPAEGEATTQAGEDVGNAARGMPQSPGQQGHHGNGEASESMGTLPQMDHEGFITILTHSRAFNLLHLRNGQADLLADTEIPAGSYDQMRLVVTDGMITLMDGRMFHMKVPSGEQSGIKLNFDFEVGDGEETTLLLDVDLSRAFRAIPGGPPSDDPAQMCSSDRIREFHFAPAFAMRLINVMETGSISGVVIADETSNPVANAAVTAFDENGEEVTTTSTDENGMYMLVGLAPGTYRVYVAAAGFHDADVLGVEVMAGQETMNIDVTLFPPE